MKKIVWILLSGTLLFSSCNDKPEVQPTADNFLMIYPNPTSGPANIKVRNQNTGTFTLKVFDTKGKPLFNKNGNQGQTDFTVPLDNEPKGRYVVVLTSGNVAVSQILLKL
jgi:hypothetical protein